MANSNSDEPAERPEAPPEAPAAKQSESRETGRAKRAAIRAFLVSAAIVFGVAGISKLLGAAGEHATLEEKDPILLIKTRYVMLCVGLVEIMAAVYLVRGRLTVKKLWLTVWVAGNLIHYRAIIAVVGVTRPCGCLGNLTDFLPLTPRGIDLTLQAILVYLLLGGAFCLRWSRAPAAPKNVETTETE